MHDFAQYTQRPGDMTYSISPQTIQPAITSEIGVGLPPNIDASMPAEYQSSNQFWCTPMMTPLQTAFDQALDFRLIRSAQISPSQEEFYDTRRASATSAQDGFEWQDKTRSERRKVQNRAAQRAYRERKEKTLSDMRDLLDRKEAQIETLRKDHEELQRKYERLVQISCPSSSSTTPSTCNPRTLFKSHYSDDSLQGSLPEQEEG